MINHARNLLLNVQRTQLLDLPGHEYVPADFVPVANLPDYIRKIRTVLFGLYPDTFMYNYRLRQLLPILHGSELADYLTTFDSRITYWPQPPDIFFQTFGLQSNRMVGDSVLAIGGNELQEQNGTVYFQWTADLSLADELTLTPNYPTQPATTTAVTYTDGLSQPITIPGTSVTLRVTTPSSATVWKLSGVAKPAKSLANVVWSLNALSDELQQLFGTSQLEPWLTFKNLWEQQQSVYRLARLLCALIYRMHELYSHETL